jgi:hypothetical protein
MERVDDEDAFEEHRNRGEQERLRDDLCRVAVELGVSRDAQMGHGARNKTAAETLEKKAFLCAHQPRTKITQRLECAKQSNDLEQLHDACALDHKDVGRDLQDTDPKSSEDDKIEPDLFIVS